jgi:serine/threonine-protein kinase
MTSAVDRHLLFGLLALQNGIVNQSQLVAAFQAWTLDRSKSLAEYLVVRSDLDEEDRAAVEALAARHIKRHGGDVERSLAAVPANRSIRESLARLDDVDIAATMGHLGGPSTEIGDDPYRTVSYSVGTASSDGVRFRVLRPHARGGLGAVFVALDTEMHREVALKQILDQHADDAVSRQRFMIEAEITGGLEHPGIVPVYGLGTYGDGRPFYAMRFIRGDSLKEAIERFHHRSGKGVRGRAEGTSRELELHKLLRRFIDVCNAIDYAHSRGVVHRDIKPANIIVGTHGETLVVDWGLAKATGHGGAVGEEPTAAAISASGSADTLPGSALGTPAYMSPEQACGDLDRLGPRSDVYSLGSTLYCLLTGKPPYEGGDVGELLRMVQRGEFIAPRQIDPSLDKALEAVCLKAMALKSEERYPSCRALADDVERWMADEAVAAWAEPWTRKLLRWLTRHRTSVTGAAAAVLAGVVGLAAVTLVQTQAKANIARALDRETQTSAALARSKAAVQSRYDLALAAIKTFHTGVSEDFLLKEEQFEDLRNRLLHSASDFYEKLGALLTDDADVPSRRALLQANYELAELTDKVGRTESALEAHRQVLVAREELAKEPKAGTEVKAEVGRSMMAVARLQNFTGKTDQALSMYRRSESLLANLSTLDPTALPELAVCRSALGEVLASAGNAADALEVFRLARNAQAPLAAAPSATNRARRELADTMVRIGNLLATTGRPAEAEAEYSAALPIRSKLVDENPASTDFRKHLADCQDVLGVLLFQEGKLNDAEKQWSRALAIRRKLADDNPAVTTFRSDLAMSHNALGNLLADSGRAAEAEREYRQSLAIRQKLVADNPSNTALTNRLAAGHYNLGVLLREENRPADSEVEYRAALAIQAKLAESNPTVAEHRSRLANTHLALSELLAETGRRSEAEALDRRAVALASKLTSDHPSVTQFRNYLAECRANLGRILAQTGRTSDAAAEYRAALGILTKLAADNPSITEFRKDLANCHHDFGNLLLRTDRPAEAENEYRTALTIRSRLAEGDATVTQFRTGIALALDSLGAVIRALGRAAEARDAHDRAIAIHEQLVGENLTTASYRRDLASSLLQRGLTRRILHDATGAAADTRRAVALYDGFPSRTGADWFEKACCRAALFGMDDAGVSAAETAINAEMAMAMLRKAVGLGFDSPFIYGTEASLEPLRARDDFRLLLMDLAMPAKPIAPAH